MATAALFPGQGSQQVGMGRDLIERSVLARDLYQLADETLQMPITRICCEAAENALQETANQQPALYTTSMARWHMLCQDADFSADYLAGHSMGQLCALTAADSITFKDGLRLANIRGQAMQQAGKQRPGSMAAILKLTVSEVAEICGRVRATTHQILSIGAENCPGQTVISGDTAAVQQVMTIAQQRGAKTNLLPISIASHSPLMATATIDLHHVLEKMTIIAPKLPVISNLSAAPLTTPNDIRYELKYTLTRRLRWTQSMRYLIANGVTRMVEIGPGNVLTGLLKRIDSTIERSAFNPAHYAPPATRPLPQPIHYVRA